MALGIVSSRAADLDSSRGALDDSVAAHSRHRRPRRDHRADVDQLPWTFCVYRLHRAKPRRDCRAVAGISPGRQSPFVLFVLCYIVLVIAAGMIGCIVACATCCVAAIPYVGTVILLPVVMVLFAFPLCFLRQFGDPYDVWEVVRPTEPPPIPPVQET